MNQDEQVREVYAHFGLAVYMAQVLEHALINAMVVGRLPQSARVTSSEIDDFMSEQFDATLGKLVLARCGELFARETGSRIGTFGSVPLSS